MTKLVASKTCPPIGAMITAKAVSDKVSIAITWGQDTYFSTAEGSTGATTSAGSARCLARLAKCLYGKTILEQTEVDHWLTFTLGPLNCSSELVKALPYLDTVLQPATWLVGDTVSIADYEVFGSLANNPSWLWMVCQSQAPSSLLRWFNMMSSRPEVSFVMSSLPEASRAKAAAPQAQAKEKKEESAGGKFVELPGAKIGEVVVRFPPEASGFLHVGHAKAALLNNYYKETFQGKLVMRFDDTNPAKEKEEYEDVILEDLKMLQVRYDFFSRTSDHFETILNYCEKLMKDGKAYVDDTDAETMKVERDAKTQSKNWNNSVEKNLSMWKEMKAGSDSGTKCAVRAKIDMQSPNGCLRDPTIYRCKPEPHPSTGTKYKVYPTYDFACPIVDSVEGVTHALRTTEYTDRDDQFNWFIDALGLRKPYIWAYARLNLTNTVMSKRKLTWLVETGAVDGWDDPRLPTVRGIIRRGLTVEALQQFIIAQGSSRSVVFMEWDKIWALNKKVLDPVVARHTTVDLKYNVPVSVMGVKVSSHMSPKHPKNTEVGEKTVWTGPRLIIDGVDAEQLKDGENATFINWGNLMIKKVNKKDGKVVSVDAEENTDNKDFKKTLKVTWLCDDQEKSSATPAVLVYYDHIISKAILEKDDDFKKFVNTNSKHEFEMLGDPEMRSLKKGDMIQIQRRGYFICDVEYRPYSPCVGRARPVVLLSIPDGSVGSYGAPGRGVPAIQPVKGGSKVTQEGKKQTAAPAKQSTAPAKQSTSPVKQAVAACSVDVETLNTGVAAQGELVRKLKTEKAAKPDIDEAVKKLLALKAEFKSASGLDWKPGMTLPKVASPVPAVGSADTLSASVGAQGDLVRKLKTDKAAKPDIDGAVKKLLALKAEYKTATGSDWKPGAAAHTATPAAAASGSGDALNAAITAQGDLVRKLKTEKAAKPEIDVAVKKLLTLKAEYKTATGSDWKPGAAAPAAVPAVPTSGSVDALNSAITAQGDLVRKLKTEKADKPKVDVAVKNLLALKAEYKAATGSDWKPGVAPPAAVPGLEVVSTDLNAAVSAQGDLVRKLKGDKAAKSDIDEAVKKLLSLKAEYKASTGSDWKPGATQAPAKQANAKKELLAAVSDGPNGVMSAKVGAQGDLVRQLKGDKKPKEEIDMAVKQLLALKAEFKAATGSDWQPAGGAAKKPEKQKKAAKEVKPKEKVEK